MSWIDESVRAVFFDAVGTLLNAASVVATMVLLKNDAPTWVAALMHFGLLPYNVFLVTSTWRAARKRPGVRAGALLWFSGTALV